MGKAQHQAVGSALLTCGTNDRLHVCLCMPSCTSQLHLRKHVLVLTPLILQTRCSCIINAHHGCMCWQQGLACLPIARKHACERMPCVCIWWPPWWAPLPQKPQASARFVQQYHLNIYICHDLISLILVRGGRLALVNDAVVRSPW